MTGGPAGARSVVLLDKVVDEGVLGEAGVELLNISDLPVIGSHVRKVVEVDDGHTSFLNSLNLLLLIMNLITYYTIQYNPIY